MEKIMYNYSKLKGRVTECFDTQENFANAMGMSRVSISQKLNNISYFSQYEIDKACELLEKHRIGTTCDEENYKKCMENHCFNSCIHLRNMTKEECKEWCMKDE